MFYTSRTTRQNSAVYYRRSSSRSSIHQHLFISHTIPTFLSMLTISFLLLSLGVITPSYAWSTLNINAITQKQSSNLFTTNFQSTTKSTSTTASTCLFAKTRSNSQQQGGYESQRYASASLLHQNQFRSKRQERVGHLVQTELAYLILTRNHVPQADVPLPLQLSRQISIVKVDVSPDLRQARVSVSIRANKNSNNNNNDGTNTIETNFDGTVQKRQAYSWLVRNTKAIKHALAQRISHMKTCPNLTFVQVDVGAAVDVMQLIDQVAAGYKRQDLTSMDDYAMQRNDEDEDWVDEDDEFFK